jgi:chemotaxis protein MotB
MLTQQQALEEALRQQMATLQASLQAEINADQVKIQQLENGIRVSMSSDLLYPSGAVTISHQGRSALAKVAGQLTSMAAQGYEIDVVGNTDDVPIGPELAERYPTNWELAGARAALVVRYLQESGVDPTKLEAISGGQYHPVAANDTPAGRASNRRTDVLLRPR